MPCGMLQGLFFPVGCLESSISATRMKRISKNSSLFKSVKRPQHSIHSCTLGHWLKLIRSCVEDAGFFLSKLD